MIYLLDVNVLLAYVWTEHIHHRVVRDWCISNLDEGFALCPFTELAFVRLSSNRLILNNAVSISDALEALKVIQAREGTHFWPANIAVGAQHFGKRLRGHKELADAYLMTLAKHHGGQLVTIDRGAHGLSKLLNCPVHLITPV